MLKRIWHWIWLSPGWDYVHRITGERVPCSWIEKVATLGGLFAAVLVVVMGFCGC